MCVPLGIHTTVMGEHTMADEKMALLDVLRKGEEPEADFLRESLRWLAHELMEAEVSSQIGAERYERCEERPSDASLRHSSWNDRPRDTETPVPTHPGRTPGAEGCPV